MGVSQGSTLSPILSALYLFSLLYILEKYLKNLNISVSLISFVDDSLIISQSKSIDILNSQLFCSYNVLFRLLIKFGLNIEYLKTEMFHFNRSHETFNPPPLDLLSIGEPILHPKSSWKYLGSYLTESSCSISTSTSIRTKPSLWSNAWNSLGIHHKKSTQSKNTSYTDAMSYPLHYMNFSYSSITKPLYHTPWKSLEKCREEPLSGYWEPSEHYLQTVSKLSLVSFPLSSIFKNSQVDLNFALLLF